MRWRAARWKLGWLPSVGALVGAVLLVACQSAGSSPRSDGGAESESPDADAPSQDAALGDDDAALTDADAVSEADGGADADDAAIDAAEGGPLPFVSFADPDRTLNVVAHQDDDLGLMNPNLLNTIRLGRHVETIYLTDGAAGLPCSDYALARVAGMHAAYAQMAGVPNNWTPLVEVMVGNKRVLESQLVGAHVKLVFVGFSNPAIEVASYLSGLWDGTYQTIETSDVDTRTVRDTYTREELIETLRVLIERFSPNHVNVLDGSELQPPLWPFDHNEHVSSALFALAALQRATVRATVRMHRGYNSQTTAPPNVAKEEAAIKADVLHVYWPFDDKICTTQHLEQVQICGIPQWCDLPALLYVGYEERQYPIGLVQRAQGAIVAPGGLCIARANGAEVQLRVCDLTEPSQRWEAQRDGTIRNLGDGSCLTEGLLEGGRRVLAQLCEAKRTQQFFLTAQAQLRGPDATCVQSDGTSLRVVKCGWLDNQLGFVMAYVGAPFEVARGMRSPSGQPLHVVNLRKQQPHLCERRSDGVYCGAYRADLKRFDELTRSTEHFSDSEGFGGAGLGLLQFGDIDGDGASDVCASGQDGVYCARLDSASLRMLGYTRVLASKPEQRAFGSGNTLRVVDMNGDGRADLCAHTSAGVACADSVADGSIAAPTLRSAAFSDAAGFSGEARASTLQFGDVNGDGRADACMRGANGVRCALGDDHGQLRFDHLYSHPGELTDDAGYQNQRGWYGSLRLRDVDGDGRADLCGTLGSTLRCGLSTGTTFGPLLPVLVASPPFEAVLRSDDAASVALPDLNGDGRSDVCLRTWDGVTCAQSF